MKTEISGRIISLIHVNRQHLALMVNWRNNPVISNMLFDRGTFTLAKQKAWYEIIKKDKSTKQFIIVENKTKKPIGAINLSKIDYINMHCDWGFYIGEPQYRMGGYAVEAEYLILKYAFGVLGMNKVYCQTISSNYKVINAHSKFGFKTDGILRKHYKENGSFSNVVIMSILKDEFKKSARNIDYILKSFSR
jgi:UDP-4-amino-4,6-dideoxy-N-acetyl-beta-L-altrosamine N-acetyltransferase